MAQFPVSTSNEQSIHAALELSKNSWLLAIQVPGRDNPSLYPIRGGHAEGLMAKLDAARDRVAQLTGQTPKVTLCYEAGYDGFWLSRFLEQRGIECRVMEPASLQVNRRARRVKTGAIRGALACSQVFGERPDLVRAYLPETLPAQRRWLKAIRCAMPFGPPFVEWVARNVTEMPGRTILEIESQVENVSDWVKASYQVSVDEALAAIPQYMIDACDPELLGARHRGQKNMANYVTRRFSSDMSLRTVFGLSDEWHEAVANHQSAHSTPFPEPWAGPADVDGYQITPITNDAELYREGKRMKHCVGSYMSEVTWNNCYFHHVEKGDEPVATVQLLREGTKPKLGQVRGPCNSIVDKKIMQVLRKWVRQIKEVPALERPSLTEIDGPCVAQNAADQWLDDIPF